ncbi:MAG: alpha/beta fold hydrolase [Gammaproteobacteria bacterium]|nr:MAG: alpha/beta fold hydrolase [Gammaproteobacteria bacterium]
MSRLHVSKFGQANNGPVLALLHGWGSSSKIWQACIADLSKEFQLWCVDLPGHGHSHDIEWDESVDQGVELLANTLPPSCVLIAWSLGGMLAQLYLKQFPQRVQSLMLIASTPKFVASKEWPHAMPPNTFTRFVKQYDASPKTTLKQFCALQTLHSTAAKKSMQALEQASNQHQDKIRWGLRWLKEIDLRDLCLSKNVPIVLLQGENDQVSSVRAAEHTAEIWGHLRICKITDAGHVPFLSHSEQFIDLVKSMFAQTEKQV